MLTHIYKYLRTLSLDVAFGASASSWGIAQVLDVELPWIILLELSLAVWVIYTLDHLMDARKIKHSAHTFRHAFHQRHFRALSIVTGMAIVAGMALLYYLPDQTLYYGLILAALVGFYFLILKLFYRNFSVWKELFIATLYTCGIFLAPISLYEGNMFWEIIIILAQFFFIALINLLIFSYFEVNSDRQDGHCSLVLVMGRKKSLQWIYYLSTLLFALSIALYTVNHSSLLLKAEFVIILMNISLIIILQNRRYFAQYERYRSLGDMVFVFPLLIGF